MSFDPDAIYSKTLAAGEDWADKKSAYEALDDVTKSVLADITLNFMDGKTSKAEAETRALASADYKSHLANIKAARKVFLVAQVRYEALKALSENRRSQESTRRAEMTLR